jgi:hypothetical protein
VKSAFPDKQSFFGKQRMTAMSRIADLGAGKMLRDARMAGLVKPRCGNGDPGQ